MILTKLDQHVSEVMKTADKEFQNFGWSRIHIIIMQNVNMVTIGKCKCRLNSGSQSQHITRRTHGSLSAKGKGKGRKILGAANLMVL